jgi:hypothetical protein
LGGLSGALADCPGKAFADLVSWIFVEYGHLLRVLFHRFCPYPAEKPPLPAPVLRLDPSPPDFTAVKRLLDGAG